MTLRRCLVNASVIGEYHAVPNEAEMSEATAARLRHGRSNRPSRRHGVCKHGMVTPSKLLAGKAAGMAWLRLRLRVCNTETAAVHIPVQA